MKFLYSDCQRSRLSHYCQRTRDSDYPINAWGDFQSKNEQEEGGPQTHALYVMILTGRFSGGFFWLFFVPCSSHGQLSQIFHPIIAQGDFQPKMEEEEGGPRDPHWALQPKVFLAVFLCLVPVMASSLKYSSLYYQPLQKVLV